MSYLTERLPPALRLVVGSRTEPPLPLERREELLAAFRGWRLR